MRLMVSTNIETGKRILNGIYNDLVWASDNMETVVHYYEGCVVELDIALDTMLRVQYVSSIEGVYEQHLTLDTYTYGMRRTACPANARWYSFSASYIQSHLKYSRLIYPDLSKWQEEE